MVKRKKRFLAGTMAVLLMMTAGCAHTGGGEDPATTASTTEPTAEAITEPTGEASEPVRTVTLQDALAAIQPATHYDWADSLPRMDGSTSTIPLEAGIRAALFGTSMAEAETQVKHSTTWGSFYNLIDGHCDLIFSVPLSERQITEARERNMELEMTRIAAEGFVFVVNAKNPVDVLTQEQLRDIYSGKITNWAQVGGNDAAIVAYQRNEDSGSQNFMHTFMGDTPLMDPLTSARRTPSSMGQLMDAVATYDNAENAIGYSVYAYAADMYGNGNEIKFIHVDGVVPNKGTMSDGSYPLLSYNYAVYNKATAADTPLRRLVEWITTDEGQRAVKTAGYVPLRPVGEAEETVVRLYTATGTGCEKPAERRTTPYYYTLKTNFPDDVYPDTWGELPLESVVDALKNDRTQALIEKFMADAGVEGRTRDFECINGYLAIQTEQNVALFDLAAGKRIAFSDLFYKDEEYISTINDIAARRVAELSFFVDEGYGDDMQGNVIKRPFVGVEAGFEMFGLRGIDYWYNSIYFKGSPWLGVSYRELGDKMVLHEPRDMHDLFDDSVTFLKEFWVEDGYGVKEPLLLDDLYAETLDPTHYDAALCDKVNAAIRTFCRVTMSRDALQRWYREAYGDGVLGAEGAWINLRTLGDRYFYLDGETLFLSNGSESAPDYGVVRFYDKATGEPVPFTALLKDGWKEASRWMKGNEVRSGETTPYDGETIVMPSFSGLTLYKIESSDTGLRLTFGRRDRSLPIITAEVPAEYVNWELN